MYRKEPKGQLSFEDFYLSFGGHLNKDNRWVRLAALIPWGDFEGEYEKGFSHEACETLQDGAGGRIDKAEA